MYVVPSDETPAFFIHQIALHLSEHRKGEDIPILKLVIDSLGTRVEVRTFDLMVNAYIGSVYLQHLEFKGQSA